MFNYQMLRQKTIVTQQRRNTSQILGVQTENYYQSTKKKRQPNSKCTEKTIVNRQERNISRIANVQRKVRRTDRSPCKHTIKYRQSSPCKHGKIIDKYFDKIRTTKKSTKFNLQIQCNSRQSTTKLSFKFALQIQRYR